MGLKVIVVYKDGRTTKFPNAEVKYDSTCGTYAIQKEDGGTIYVPSSFVESITTEEKNG